MNCSKINLKRGSRGADVKSLQTILRNKGLYTGSIDGNYGVYTENAVKAYQRQQKLSVDGVYGPVTCRKLNSTTPSPTQTPSSGNSSVTYTIFTNTKLCEQQKPDCAGQVSPYHCACHAIKQALRRFGITGYSERTIGNYAGTTTNGTGHSGIETAIAYIAKQEGITLQVKWVNFSDLGDTSKERWRKYGDLMTDDNKAVFHHELYRGKYGHYSLLKQVNVNSMLLIVQNSLGNRYGSGYAGYMESRNCSTQERYLNGISQKSICIITKQ
jgi:peptidoglycan hydrolase-like protein with peptidoglycan-binding domain